MAAIKKFFEKRKLDVKFKRAGEGHKLTEASRQNRSIEERPPSTSPRRGPSNAALTAAEAAMARASISSKPGDNCKL